MSPLVAPSILSADFSDLKKEVLTIEKSGADWVHIDVMDGSFVPNITIGPEIVKSIRKHSTLPFDIHLMINHPENYIEKFVEAGANLLTVHPEACIHLHRVLRQIHSFGIKAGVALNPHTPLNGLEYILEEIDLILIMTVNPGFGGQKFIPSLIKKIEDTRKLINSYGKDIYLEVDGGINLETAEFTTRAGANVLVAGNAIFSTNDRAGLIKHFKNLTSCQKL